MTDTLSGQAVIQVDSDEPEEECEHFFPPVPKSWCDKCSGSGGNKKKQHIEEERNIIDPPRQPCKGIWKWDPYREPVTTIPKDRDCVHITTSFSVRQLEDLIDHLPDLVLVEIVPSRAGFIERYIPYFCRYRIGIVARRRYKQR